jgi:hypothetical protein
VWPLLPLLLLLLLHANPHPTSSTGTRRHYACRHHQCMHVCTHRCPSARQPCKLLLQPHIWQASNHTRPQRSRMNALKLLLLLVMLLLVVMLMQLHTQLSAAT